MSNAYIAGPMKGIDEHNFPTFNATAKYLRENIGKLEILGGVDTIINPAELNHPDEGKTWNQCLTIDIKELMTCSTIILLPNWQKSKGASLERTIAKNFDMTLLEFDPETKTLTKFKDNTGIKFDLGKLRYDLVPPGPQREIVKVLTCGAEKYADNNWQIVENAVDTYTGALMRHIEAWREGEEIDPETGLHHLAHAGCNILFLLWFDENLKHPNESDHKE